MLINRKFIILDCNSPSALLCKIDSISILKFMGSFCLFIVVFMFARVMEMNKTTGSINALGLGVYLGVATFAYGNENSCRTAEILAINDDCKLPSYC